MKESELLVLIQITKSKIDKGDTLQDIEKFVINIHGQNVMDKIRIDVEEYIQIKKAIQEKNKKYWMLVSNPLLWGDEDSAFKVNEIFKNLHKQEDGEWWKINDNTNMELKMKIGERGIIKISDDHRDIESRTDKNGKIVPLLEAGIYGIFETIPAYDDEKKCVQISDGLHWVHIKLIDNFFDKGMNISKEKSIELLSENIYKSQSSREIEKFTYENIVKYIDSVRN